MYVACLNVAPNCKLEQCSALANDLSSELLVLTVSVT